MQYIRTTVQGWFSTENRTLYIHEDTGTIVRCINHKSTCRNCLKKFTVEHPNKTFKTKVVKASAHLDKTKLDRHITSMAMKIIEKGIDIENITAPPSKMCIDCMELATLTSSCSCGNTMADSKGMVLINVANFEVKNKNVNCFLNMHGYQPIQLHFLKEHVRASDVMKLKTSSKQIESIHVNARVVRDQIINYKQELTDK